MLVVKGILSENLEVKLFSKDLYLLTYWMKLKAISSFFNFSESLH